MRILVTGAAGFIGYHLSRRLLQRGDEVIGVDSLTPYYDVALKRARLAELASAPGAGRFTFAELDLADRAAVASTLSGRPLDAIAHLAAQVGVRYSLTAPHAYVASNLQGFVEVLELARHTDGLAHLVFASSSSVYGGNASTPYRVGDPVDRPVSLYGATKRADELMAHSYAHLFGVPTTGLRFFTVYGPWGRPDMAYWRFTERILRGEPIPVYNRGDLARDFTYVDDIVEGLVRVLDAPPPPTDDSSARFRLYNLGRGQPVPLMGFIRAIEAALGRSAELELLPMQPGDMHTTWADTSGLERDHGYRPQTTVEDGVRAFVQWYRAYHSA